MHGLESEVGLTQSVTLSVPPGQEYEDHSCDGGLNGLHQERTPRNRGAKYRLDNDDEYEEHDEKEDRLCPKGCEGSLIFYHGNKCSKKTSDQWAGTDTVPLCDMVSSVTSYLQVADPTTSRRVRHNAQGPGQSLR